MSKFETIYAAGNKLNYILNFSLKSTFVKYIFSYKKVNQIGKKNASSKLRVTTTHTEKRGFYQVNQTNTRTFYRNRGSVKRHTKHYNFGTTEDKGNWIEKRFQETPNNFFLYIQYPFSKPYSKSFPKTMI